jgi:uncharacterized membrane protein YfcA
LNESSYRRYPWIGLLTGVMGGALGVGGGAIAVPLMTALGETQRRAQGILLAAVVPSSLASALYYGWLGHLRLLPALFFAVAAMPGARIGSLLAQRLSNRILYRAFGLLLLALAIRIVLPFSPPAAERWDTVHVIQSAAAGLCAGAVGGLLGVGGGILFVPAGILLLGLEQRVAQAASLLAIVPTAAVSHLAYRRSGETDRRGWILLSLGMIPGGVLGAIAAHHLPVAALRIGLAVLLGVIALPRLFGRAPR